MGNAQRVLNSGVRGVVAAMAMSGTRALTHSLGLVDQTPPEAVLHQQAPSLMAKFPREKRPAVTELAHWTFGAVAGAGFALLPVRLRRPRWAGAVYGLVVLTSFEGHRPAAGAVSGSAYAAGGACGIPGRPYALRHRARPTTARIILTPFSRVQESGTASVGTVRLGYTPNTHSERVATRVRLGSRSAF